MKIPVKGVYITQTSFILKLVFDKILNDSLIDGMK